VTEISEYLGVSPKAVIDHLDKLERAGLVESRVDDQRRKYFHIARNLRLEVNVSPYEFGTKSAYPASRVDVTTCRYVSIDAEFDEGGDTTELARELNLLRDLETELSMAQRWVHGRLTDVMDDLTDQFEDEDGRLYGDVVSALATRPGTVDELSRRLETPPEVLVEALRRLEDQGIVVADGDEWRLPD
jgi:ArsR family transcriptional regulator